MTKIRSTDKSRVKDVRGQSGGGGGGGLGFPFPGMGGSGSGGGGMSFPGGAKAGGGLLGVVVLLAALFLPKLLGAGATQSAADVPASAGSDQCVTELEQIMCGANESVQDYWAAALPQYYGTAYQYTSMVWFTGGVSTGCGQASSETGPFYCPLDSLVYIDLGFMQQLENMLIGTTSDLAEQYIIAHEYGHHVQNLLGTNAQVQRAQQNDPSRANQYSVALELQADCYAGVWAHHASTTNAPGSDTPFLKPLSDKDIADALSAAQSVGDDRIQKAATGRVNKESWTHGSAAQRQHWFTVGYQTGDARKCDTYSATDLDNG